MSELHSMNVYEMLQRISHWHDSENPSRMALGAVASCTLNHVNILNARIAALEAQLAERDKLIQMAWDATLDFRTVHNSRPSSWAECEKQTAQTICDCNDALEAFLYPEPQPLKEPK